MGLLGRRLGRGRAARHGVLSRRPTRPGQRPKKVGDVLAVTTGDTFTFYLRLVPDGRELGPVETQRAQERLGAGAECLRVVDEKRELILRLAEEGQNSGADTDLRPTISMLRSMQRSLVLAISEDPSRRKMAMPTDELKARAEAIYETWRGLVDV
jgi:hypothetical protein